VSEWSASLPARVSPAWRRAIKRGSMRKRVVRGGRATQRCAPPMTSDD